MSKLLTLEQISKICDINEEEIIKWIKSGKIIATKVNNEFAVDIKDLKLFLNNYLIEFLDKRRESKDMESKFNVLQTLCTIEKQFSASSISKKRKNILIIDDNGNYINNLKLIIKNKFKNINILSAKDGYSACKILIKQSIDLAIIDILMPNMDGLQLCRLIKSIDNFRNLNIIVISGLITEDAKEELEKLKINNFINKPFDVNKLINIMKFLGYN